MNRIALALGLLAAGAAAQSRGAADCERQASLTLPDTTITAAEAVSGGPFNPAGAPNTQKPVPVEARCRVTAVIKPSSDSSVEIEVWMPASGWNGKFQAVGNGGWSGSINYGGMIAAIADHYATASTDTGHKGGSGSFALSHPERVVDFAYRSEHEMTVKAKAIIASYYGSAPRLSYWNGCSSGGKQGLKEAQRFPADYDGILAGAPANNWTHLLAALMYVGVTNLKNPAATIPPAKLALIHNAVLAACDSLDGVKDGVLTDPRQCHFDPSTLLCRGSDTAGCLTAEQVATAKTVYGPVKNPRTGDIIYPGLAPGSEMAWGPALGGPEPFAIPYDHFKYLVHEDAKWDWRNFDLARDTATADEKDRGLLAAVDPNLTAFQARGGKLLMWHGWSDQLIAPENSIRYYDSVLAAMGPKQDGWIRLFMAPGMLHCGGGPGPNQFNGMAALERWVENGIAPAQITAFHTTDNRVDITRPLCPHPQVAVYRGNGSTNDAENFTCRAPN